MDYDKLTADEIRRSTRHDSVKSRVERDVNAEIAVRADHTTRPEAERMEQVAGDFRRKAIEQLVGIDREVRMGRGLARLSQFVDYAFYVLYSLLGIRLALALIGANPGAGFVQLIRTITNPVYTMFRGIVASPVAEDGSTLAMPIVVAIIAYMLLHLAIKGFFRLIVHRRTAL